MDVSESLKRRRTGSRAGNAVTDMSEGGDAEKKAPKRLRKGAPGDNDESRSEGDTDSEVPPHQGEAGPATATSENGSKAAPSLEDMLDLSDLSDQSQVQARFDAIAKALLCDFHLVVSTPARTTTLEILELEFYLQKEGFHEDPFTHGSEEQKVSGRWYFHRAPRPSKDANRSLTSTTSWRGGSRKGMDLTIGRRLNSALAASTDDESLLRGGILLRSIRVTGPNPKVVSGPSLLVDQILSSSGVSEIGDLVNGKWDGDTSAFASSSGQPRQYSLHLVPRPQHSTSASSAMSRFFKPSPSASSMSSQATAPRSEAVIYRSPRIGLDLSHPGTTPPSVRPLHSRIIFLPRRYRYFRNPELLIANGRPQTFLGVVDHCARKLASATQQTNGIVSSTHASGSSTNATTPGKLDAPSKDELSKALSNPRLLSDVCKITQMKEPTAQRYLEDYREGLRGGAKGLTPFIGPSGKGAGSSPKKWLEMMGALASLDL